MQKLIRWMDANFERYLCLFLFSIMVLLTAAQVLFRFVINFSLDWTEELSRYLFIASIYAGSSLAVKTNDHIRVEVIHLFLPPSILKIFRIFADCIWLSFSILIMIQGFGICSKLLSIGQTSPTLRFPMGMIYGIIPIGFMLMNIRLIQSLYFQFRNIRSHTAHTSTEEKE